jgi:uncharacterized Zn finger protein (UPF0148 family)
MDRPLQLKPVAICPIEKFQVEYTTRERNAANIQDKPRRSRREINQKLKANVEVQSPSIALKRVSHNEYCTA